MSTRSSLACKNNETCASPIRTHHEALASTPSTAFLIANLLYSHFQAPLEQWVSTRMMRTIANRIEEGSWSLLQLRALDRFFVHLEKVSRKYPSPCDIVLGCQEASWQEIVDELSFALVHLDEEFAKHFSCEVDLRGAFGQVVDAMADAYVEATGRQREWDTRCLAIENPEHAELEHVAFLQRAPAPAG